MSSPVNEDGERIFEPGEFILYAGGFQPDARSEALTGEKPLQTEIALL